MSQPGQRVENTLVTSFIVSYLLYSYQARLLAKFYLVSQPGRRVKHALVTSFAPSWLLPTRQSVSTPSCSLASHSASRRVWRKLSLSPTISSELFSNNYPIQGVRVFLFSNAWVFSNNTFKLLHFHQSHLTCRNL